MPLRRATAAEKIRGTTDWLLAAPLSRTRVMLDKAARSGRRNPEQPGGQWESTRRTDMR